MPLKARKLRKAAQKAKQTFQLLKSATEHAFSEKWMPERLGKKLIKAVMSGDYNPEYAEDIIRYGADIETRDRYGWTALMYAAANGHIEFCELLLEHNANIEARTPKGSTPLMLAVMYDKDGTAKVLMEHGARIDAKNGNGDTVYEIAKRHKEKYSIRIMIIYDFAMKMVEKLIQQDAKEWFEPQFFACTNRYPLT